MTYNILFDEGITDGYIEGETQKPRKDIGKWSDVRDDLYFFFDKLYYSQHKSFSFPLTMNKAYILEILEKYSPFYNENDDKQTLLTCTK